MIYGLIRNIPHYFFLSFLGAELFARFVYDSLWLPYRKNESIWQTKYKREKEFEDADDVRQESYLNVMQLVFD